MKEHAKKALKHDFQVAGKTIPTLAVAALLLVGTGSAALLTNFGTVSGTADVSQAVTIDGASDDILTASSYDQGLTAGQTVAETFSLSNDAEIDAEVSFDSNASEVDGIHQAVYRANVDLNELILDRSGTPSSKSDWAGSGGDVGHPGAFDYQFVDDLSTLQIQIEKVDYNENSASATIVVDEDQDGTSDYQVSHYPGSWSVMDADGTDERDVSALEGVNAEAEDVDGDGTTEYVINISRDRFGTSLDLAVTTEEHSTAVEARSPSPGEFDWTDSTNYEEISLKDSEVTGSASVPSDGSSTFVVETQFAINLVGDHTVGVDVVPTGTDVDGEPVEVPE